MTAVTLLAAVVLAPQTKPVEFRFAPEGAAKTVHLAGSFNGWSTTANPMQPDEAGQWSLRLDLPFGKHWYKFVVDGSNWFTDPGAASEDDGNGNMNSFVVVLPPGFERPAKRGDGQTTWEAVRHPTEPPHRNFDRGRLRLTVVTRAGDVESVRVRFDGESYALRLAGGDEIEERYAADVPWDGKTDAKYAFTVTDGDRGAWLTRQGLVFQVGERFGEGLHFRIGASEAARMPRPPSWVEDSVFYQIFPDRFDNADPSNDPPDTQPWDGTPTWFNWFGGDLAGVERRLGHLESLGVSAVYFNPVFQGPSNHRYETTDYRKIDSRLGTNAQFAALVKEMRRRGMRTVLDGVFNHTAVDFPPFADLLARQQHSPYASWYEVSSFPVAVQDNPPYKAWFGFPSMPELDFRNPDVRDMVLDVVDFWEREAAIDGWRLDVANEVPDAFWREFRRRVKSHSLERWICGEIWGDGSQWLMGDQFDSVMNYRFREAVLGLVARRSLPPSGFLERLMDVHEDYGPQTSRNMLNLLGSHDTPRILTECGGDARRAQFAAQLQFAWVGAPCVYYGDELGMAGGRDPENRRGMAWSTATGSNEYLRLYKRLAQARNRSAALRRGDPEPLPARDEEGLLAFRRVLGGDRVLVVANASEQPREYTVTGSTWGARLPSSLTDLYSGTVSRAAQGKHQLQIPALTAVVLAPGQAHSSPAPRATDQALRGPSHP